MNCRLLFALSACLAVSLVSPAEAGWGPSGCTTQPAAVAAFSGWEARKDAPHCMGYFVNGVQVAYYNSRTHIFRDYDAARDVWGPPKRAPWAEPCKSNCQCEQCEDGCECPKGAPCGDGRCGCLVAKQAKAGCSCKCGCGADCPCADRGPCEEGCSCQASRKNVGDVKNAGRKRDCQWAEPDGSMNYGIDLDKMKGGERASINGREVSKRQLLEAIGAPTIPDDANLLRLTVVAEDAAALSKLKAALLPQLAPIADKVVVQWYTKDNWAVRPEYGFRFDKLPAVLLQEPEKTGERGGRALFQAALPGDPAPVFAAVRSKIDSYDPKKVPGMPGSPMNIPPIYGLGALAAVVVGYSLLKR